MTDAPEKIWAWPHHDKRGWYAGGCSTEVNLGMLGKQADDQAEYTRTDIAQARYHKVEREAVNLTETQMKWEARIAELEARNGELGKAVAYATQKFTRQEVRIVELEKALEGVLPYVKTSREAAEFAAMERQHTPALDAVATAREALKGTS